MIIRKNDNEIQLMRRAGKIVGDALAMLQEEKMCIRDRH